MIFHRQLSALKTLAYRRPKDELQRLWRWGPYAYLRYNAWTRNMEHAAWQTLSRSSSQKHSEPVSAWLMTGARHWYQTAFCAWSLQRHIPFSLHLHLIDDGTLTPDIERRLRELFPVTEVFSRSICDGRIESILPPKHYPRIHAWRNIQLLFRKLTDLHAGSTTWKLFLDSDMLFFRRPDELVAWWDQSDRCLFQTDCWESYGYSRALTEKLTGCPLPERVNIGIFSLNGSLIDWDEVEHWLGILESCEGRKYNITQCVTTMIISRQAQERLDAERYLVFPGPGKLPVNEHRVLEHYVSDSKPHYMREAWRRALHA